MFFSKNFADILHTIRSVQQTLKSIRCSAADSFDASTFCCKHLCETLSIILGRAEGEKRMATRQVNTLNTYGDKKAIESGAL